MRALQTIAESRYVGLISTTLNFLCLSQIKHFPLKWLKTYTVSLFLLLKGEYTSDEKFPKCSLLLYKMKAMFIILKRNIIEEIQANFNHAGSKVFFHLESDRKLLQLATYPGNLTHKDKLTPENSAMWTRMYLQIYEDQKATIFSPGLEEIILILVYNFVYLTLSEIGFCLFPLVPLTFLVLSGDYIEK